LTGAGVSKKINIDGSRPLRVLSSEQIRTPLREIGTLSCGNEPLPGVTFRASVLKEPVSIPG